MHRRIIHLTGAIALATALTACGDSGDSGDSGSAAGDCTPPAASLTVGAQDKLMFDESSYQADAGCVELNYVNEGSVAHTLLIKGKSGFKLSVGTADSGSIELEPGTYRLYCDIAGHESAGMHAELTVS